jgi:hypothetical protein
VVVEVLLVVGGGVGPMVALGHSTLPVRKLRRA